MDGHVLAFTELQSHYLYHENGDELDEQLMPYAVKLPQLLTDRFSCRAIVVNADGTEVNFSARPACNRKQFRGGALFITPATISLCRHVSYFSFSN